MNEGLKFQHKIASELRKAGISVTEGLHGTDIGTPFLAIECKAHEKLNLKQTLIQARAQNHNSSRWPVVVEKHPTEIGAPIVHMEFNVFLDIVKALRDMGYNG